MKLTYCDELYSDLHKDAHGIRPSAGQISYWLALPPAQKQAEWEQLIDTMKYEQRLQEESEQRAVVEFEAQIQRVQGCGARSREDAIRWLMDAADCNGDREYFCYLNGLPYGHLGSIHRAVDPSRG